MNTTTRRAPSALAGLALTAPAFLTTTTAAATPPEPFVYDALGDSFSSGYGVPPYEDEACGRSESAYPVLLDGRAKVELDDFAACAGATTGTLTTAQLDALDADTDLVSVTIGGNDIDWSSAMRACLGGTDEQCTGATNLLALRITTILPDLLGPVYSGIAGAAPNAHVYVAGYPRIFSPEYGDYYGASAAEQQALNDTADLLNQVIATAADQHGFHFVDVTKRFARHGANAPNAWLNDALHPQSALHPNLAGNRAYAAALTAQIIPARLR